MYIPNGRKRGYLNAMIPFLKNFAFRVWIAGLLAFLASLWLLAQTGDTASLGIPLLIFGILYTVAFAGCGWLTDQIVRIQLAPLLHEAGILERGGMGSEAEQAFEKALALLDSFLVSPRRRRRYLRALGERMARFYAAQAEKSDRAFKWITRYLRTHPEDAAIAEVWLQDMEGLASWTKAQQDLAARIGEVRREDRQIQRILARIYVQAGRTDFAALQTYRRLMADVENVPGPLVAALAQLFIKEGRADEWALQAYVQAARRSPPPPDLLCGLAACLRWLQDAERNRGLIDHARRVLGPIGEGELERMSSGFLPPTGSYDTASEPTGSVAMLRPGFEWMAGQISAFGRRLAQAGRTAVSGLRSPHLRTPLKVSLIGGLVLSAIALIFNTAGHLVKPPEPPPSSSQTVAVQIEPAPYTLQVAAYLKPEHADRFIKILKTRGQDAYRVEAQSQEKIWYQVRIGHFPTKAAARAHGQQLKTEAVIDDFYVANYQGP